MEKLTVREKCNMNGEKKSIKKIFIYEKERNNGKLDSTSQRKNKY